MVLEVIRPAETGETVKDVDGHDIELMNLRGNYFWAAPWGAKHGPFILVCEDLETEWRLKSRKAIVDLIECGLC